MQNALLDTLPAHLPRRLTITLWDFSWYTMTMPGEAFEDLDRAFAEAVDRGYNTVRICAMPFLLSGPAHLDYHSLHLTNLGGEFGQRTRWYNAKGGAILDGRQHLLRLFEAAKRHNCFVILSSWEYQQSPSFLTTSDWYDALMAIPPTERFLALAHATGTLISFLKDHGLADRIAYAELHNEVDLTRLSAVTGPGENNFAAQKPYLEEAVEKLREMHSDILMTVCYGIPPISHMRYLADTVQVGHFHLYIYGVLDQLIKELGERTNAEPFPNDLLRSMLRSDAPLFAEWKPRPGEEWRLQATGIPRRLAYIHDWVIPDKWDLWLYDHYGLHREAMRQGLKLRLEVAADWAEQHSVPAVLGEGYVGYTPLYASFEEGPVGKDLAEYAIETCLELGFWGIILCSNAAPHHPFWQDVAWQQRMNARILAHKAL